MLVAVLGGLLGILMMIPLRRALIVAQHGMLKYPGRHRLRRSAEGGRVATSRAPRPRRQRSASWKRSAARARAPRRSSPASASASLYKTLNVAFRGWKDTPEKIFGPPFNGRHRSRPRSRRSCSASATSSDRASPRSCAPAACSRTWCSSRRSSSSAPALAAPLAPETTTPDHATWRPDADPQRLHALHRRGRGGGGRHHQRVPLAADRSGTASKAACATSAARRGRRAERAAHRPRPLDEVRAGRHHRAHRRRSPSRIRCTSAAPAIGAPRGGAS